MQIFIIFIVKKANNEHSKKFAIAITISISGNTQFKYSPKIGTYIGGIFMFAENNQSQIHLHIFSISEKDTVRIEEQYHEHSLKKRLLEFGIIADFEKITPHGFSKINGIKEYEL